MTVFAIPTQSRSVSPAHQLERLHADLERLATHVAGLSELSDEQLEALGMGEQFDAVHQCLRRFEQVCQDRSQVILEDIDVWVDQDIMQQEPRAAGDWSSMHFEAQRANRLVGELSFSLAQLRSGADNLPIGVQVPEGVAQLNQAVAAAMQDLTLGWQEPA